MGRGFRIAMAAIGGLALLLAYGFIVQAPWAVWIWLIPGSYPTNFGSLSHLFVASILAAIGAPALWIAASGEGRAIAAGSLDLGVTNAGCAAAGLWFYSRSGEPMLLAFAGATAVLTLAYALLFRRWHREPFRDRRPLPLPLRAAFAVFALLLALVGTALVVGRPSTFPWPIGRENSAIYGFIFLGAMAYFLYGLAYPVWGNAGGQMVGFLAYDLVLIGPFLQHFDSVRPAMRDSLYVYTAVLVVSGLLSVYYLFLHPGTRFRSRSRSLPQPA